MLFGVEFSVSVSNCYVRIMSSKWDSCLFVCLFPLNSRLYSNFTNFSSKVLLFRDTIQMTISHVVSMSPGFPLWQFLSLTLFFMVVKVLRNTGQIICRTSLSLGWSEFFSYLD